MKLIFKKPGLIPTLAMLMAVAFTLGLGGWQLQRLAWKQDMMEHINERQSKPPVALIELSPEEMQQEEWRNVLLSGTFLHDKELYATPRYLKGMLGYAILTPMEIKTMQGPIYVLVNRGWINPDEKKVRKPKANNTTGSVRVEGTLRLAQPKKYFTPVNKPEENLWFWYDLPAMGKATGLNLLPVIIDASATRGAQGVVQSEPTPFPIEINIRNDHLGYAITWFLIGLTALGVYAFHYIEWRRTPAEK